MGFAHHQNHTEIGIMHVGFLQSCYGIITHTCSTNHYTSFRHM